MNLNLEFTGLLEKLLNKPPAFDNVPEMSGIYQIKNLISKKVFVGSANNLRQSISRDKFLLENDSHGNKELQSDVKTYGIRAFQFEVLEVVMQNDLQETKRRYFQQFQENCYNHFMRKASVKCKNHSATLEDFQKLIKQS